jgi:hypothetical protein
MQTSITQFHGVAANGTIYGVGPHLISSAVSENVANIALGSALIRGTDPDNQVLTPSALFTPNFDFRGFAILPNTQEKLLSDATGAISWETNQQLPIAEDGYFNIACESAFVAGTICQVVCIAAGAVAAQTVGNLTATVDAINAQPINAVFQNSGAAGEIATIHLSKQV